MFVFGGYGQRQYWNELVVLDTGIMVWIRPHTQGAPPQACVLHSANLISSNSGWLMVIYGGAFDEQPLDQLLALDVATMKWSNIGSLVWDGPRPEPRFGHGAAAIGPKIFIFGGTTGGDLTASALGCHRTRAQPSQRITLCARTTRASASLARHGLSQSSCRPCSSRASCSRWCCTPT